MFIAGEANAPGTYSRRTVNFLSDLDKFDAVSFSQRCGFAWTTGNVVPLVFDVKAEIYNGNGIDFNSLSHLDSIGLIQFNNIAGFSRLNLPKRFAVNYYGRLLSLEVSTDADNSLPIGHARLTKIGPELAPICGCGPVDGFWEYVLDKWKVSLPNTDGDHTSVSVATPSDPDHP